MDKLGLLDRVLQIERSPHLDEPIPDSPMLSGGNTLRDEVLTEVRELLPSWEIAERALPKSLNQQVNAYLDELLHAVKTLTEAVAELKRGIAPSDSQFAPRAAAIVELGRQAVARTRSRQLPVHALLISIAVSSTPHLPLTELVESLEQQIERGTELIDTTLAKQLLFREAISVSQQRRAKSAFAHRADAHRNGELVFALAFGLSLLLLGLALILVWTRELAPSATYAQVAVFVTHNVILLGTASVVTRLMLKRWNLERNLRIVYEHRVAAIEQYGLFDATISDDRTAAKDELRLALAHILFTDPTTGYRDDSAAEVSITPTVNLTDRFPRGTVP